LEINVAIADDHQIVIDGLKALLDNEPDFAYKSHALNGRAAIELAKNLKIDVFLMDIDMPEMDGIEATKALKQDFPDIKVIILTMHDEKSLIKMLMDLGADGYLLKNSDQAELSLAIRNVYEGKKHFSSEVTMSLLQPDEPAAQKENLKGLTEREIEILTLIAEGLSNKEVGDKLFISHRTVDTHRTNLMKKLDVHNIAGLIRFAIKNGLVE
jgi:DNA-binding NarL/FixJ family response regulator